MEWIGHSVLCCGTSVCTGGILLVFFVALIVGVRGSSKGDPPALANN